MAGGSLAERHDAHQGHAGRGITGRSGVLVTVNGNTASACAWTTAITLQIERPLFLPGWPPVESELDDVAALYQLGRDRARQQVAAGIVGMAVAHVTVGVDDVLVGKDAVGDHELAHDPNRGRS